MRDLTLDRLGQLVGPVTGNITTLNAIPFGNPRAVEQNLGFEKGRLNAGYSILLFKTLPTPEQFIFEGTTLRSGGKLGVPAATTEEDAARQSVHQSILDERGVRIYQQMQTQSLKTTAVSGPKRMVRVVAVTEHDPAKSPEDQYPMGGGQLQWRLTKASDGTTPRMQALFAAHIDASGTAHIKGKTLSLISGTYLDDIAARTELQQYLQWA